MDSAARPLADLKGDQRPTTRCPPSWRAPPDGARRRRGCGRFARPHHLVEAAGEIEPAAGFLSKRPQLKALRRPASGPLVRHWA